MVNMKQLPPDFLKTMIRHINLMSFIGIDIFRERNKSSVRTYIRFGIFIVLFILMVVGQVLYLVLGSSTGASFLDVANAVPTTFLALQDAVKMIVILCKRDEILFVIMGVADMWPTQIQTQRKKETLQKWIRLLKTLDDTFFWCSIAAVSFYEMLPLCVTLYGMYSEPESVQYLYPLQSYFSYYLNTHWEYALGYFYLLTTSMTTHFALYIGTDFLLISLTFNLSALLALLQIDLENAVKNYDPYDQGTVEETKNIVSRHQKILWLADKLSNIFGVLIFVQVSFSSVVICFFGFLSVIAEGMLLNNLFAALGVVVSIWNLCWPGQLLVDTSFGISEAAYRSEWYNKDAGLGRYIAIIMTRAQKPCYLTALGFSSLTLANFSKVLSSSWSYLSLLNQMYKDTEA